MLFRVITFLLLASALAGAAIVGSKIPIAIQLPVIDLLLNFSAVVFGVSGIWLATAYPEILTNMYKSDRSVDKSSLANKAKKCLYPLLIASAVAVCCVVLRIAIMVGSVYPMTDDLALSRGTVFLAIVVLVMALFCALVVALLPGLQLVKDSRASAARAALKGRKFRDVTFESRDEG